MSYSYKAGQKLGQTKPQASVPTPAQIPNYAERTAFIGGMKSTKK